MPFAFGSLGLGTLLLGMVAIFTRQAWWVAGVDFAVALFALWETFGAVRKHAAMGIGMVLVLVAVAVLALGEPWVLALGNFLFGSGFLLSSAKYHHAHPEVYGPNDFLGRQWSRVATRRQHKHLYRQAATRGDL